MIPDIIFFSVCWGAVGMALILIVIDTPLAYFLEKLNPFWVCFCIGALGPLVWLVYVAYFLLQYIKDLKIRDTLWFKKIKYYAMRIFLAKEHWIDKS